MYKRQLYTLLEQFLDAKMIRETKVEGRRRSYILTDKGKDMLDKELSLIHISLLRLVLQSPSYIWGL